MRKAVCMFPNWGDASIRVAVLDGQADLEHPCFDGANVTLVPNPAGDGAPSPDALAAHGTHVASVLFGQHGSEVEGLVPNCSGFVIPIFTNESRSVSQLDLARAIQLAVEKGAHVINISGGQLTDLGEADVWLHKAIGLCSERNVLVIAAAGNDGCDCLHVPAALPNVLAVGALDRQDQPMDFSNWGEAYRAAGVMAPGEQILGAKPGGGTTRANGTSFATPLVSGAAALLLSLQASQGQTPDPLGIRQLLLDTALPCEGADSKNPNRCLAGKLNLPGAFDALTGSKDMTYQSTTRGNAISPQCACEDADQGQPESNAAMATGTEQQTAEHPYLASPFSSAVQGSAEQPGGGNQFSAQAARHNGGRASLAASYAQGARLSSIAPSQSPDEVAQAPGLVFSIGVLGYDFGTEARRDTFKQLMPAIDRETGRASQNPNADPLTTFPANPYDARQMVDYLAEHPSEARSLIWTLNIDLTPVYVIEPAGPFAAEVYEELRKLLDGEIQAETIDTYVERVSVPGLLTGRTVKLFSGQVVPVIEPQNKRGLFGWHTNALVNLALSKSQASQSTDTEIREALAGFLNRVYYDLRNLGKTSQERALNFGVTNAFQAMQAFTSELVRGMQLDEILVEKSPFCRMDSDCWDVKLRFFDPLNNQKAKRIIRYTIDVSDLIPVTMGEPRSWTTAN
jgi:cyanobactin maturation PatA/PatG family protease